MSEWQIGVLGVLALFALMVLRMPIGVAMGIVASVGIAALTGFDSAFGKLAQTAYAQSSSYVLAVIPLYMLMGELAFVSGLSQDAYYTAQRWLGHLPGGLAMATIGGSAGFAAVCGSSTAGAVLMVSVAYPEMRARNYANSLALGSIAAGGTLGILIPPSTAFVLYGIMTEQSIGKLFLAGLLPGILLTVLFWVFIYIWGKRNPTLGPRGARFSWRERLISTKDLWSVILLFGLVMGGIYLGIFNVTEAAGVGVAAAFVIAWVRGRLARDNLSRSLLNTLRTTGMVFVMIIGAMLFNYFLALSGLTSAMADFVTRLPVPPLGIIIAILALYVVLGCLLDAWAMMLIIVPAVYPVVVALGFDPLWFGVLTVLMVEMGLITPPVGLNVFIISGMVKQVPMTHIYRGVTPFVLAVAVCAALVIAFPQLALLIPYGGR